MLIHQRQWSFKNNCWSRRKFCHGRAVAFIMMVKFEGVFLSICFFCLDFYGCCLFQKEVVCDFKSLPRENYFRLSSNPLYFFIFPSHPLLREEKLVLKYPAIFQNFNEKLISNWPALFWKTHVQNKSNN